MGESEGFESFYTAVFNRLVGQLFLITGNLQDAEDAVQEALIRAAQRWPRIRGYEAPEAWVRRVALNLAANRARHARLRLRASPAEPAGGLAVSEEAGVVALGLAVVFGVLGLQARHPGDSRQIDSAAKPAVVHPFGPSHGVPVEPSILPPGSHLVGPAISLGSGSLRVGPGTEVYRWRATAQAATPRTGRSMGEACILIRDLTGPHAACGQTTIKLGASFHNPPGVHVIYGLVTQKAALLRVWVEGSGRAVTVQTLSAGALPIKFFVVVIPQRDRLAALEPLDAARRPLCRYEPSVGEC